VLRAADRSACSAAAPPISTPAGNCARSRSIVSAVSVVDGPVVGMACTIASPSPPCMGGMAAAMPASEAAIRCADAISPAGPTICRVPGAPAPKASLTSS